ncbi:MAG: TrkH family potassium uptake protein, partial [Clostridiaceae bacterium]|nr:TrkH family potassium uptake protein [Clostridiaceae bacterium]
MNFGIVIKVLGSLLLIEGACMVLPFAVSILYSEHDWLAFLICIILNVVAGYLMYYFDGSPHSSKNGSGSDGNGNSKKSAIKIKESLVIVSFGWILICLFGCLPFMISGSIPSLADAFFEIVSGFTTTGATVLSDVEVLPHGILLWRSFSHWIGGMGILVFTVA